MIKRSSYTQHLSLRINISTKICCYQLFKHFSLINPQPYLSYILSEHFINTTQFEQLKSREIYKDISSPDSSREFMGICFFPFCVDLILWFDCYFISFIVKGNRFCFSIVHCRQIIWLLVTCLFSYQYKLLFSSQNIYNFIKVLQRVIHNRILC